MMHYCASASSAAGAEVNTGAGDDGAGSAFIRPGKKNVAGETLPLALMPEQPALKSASNASIARPTGFQLDFTATV